MSNEDVTIERIVAGGDGMARLADGRVIFVGGTITGERVRVEITTNKKDFARGVALEILDASPHRVSAPCKFVAAGCGGCSWPLCPIEKRWRQLDGALPLSRRKITQLYSQPYQTVFPLFWVWQKWQCPWLSHGPCGHDLH